MRLRYLAAAGPAEALGRLSDELAGPQGPSLEPILRSPPLAVWTVPGTPHIRARDGSAAAVGAVFDRASGRRQAFLPDPVPPEPAFVEQFWGAYVLIAGDAGGGHRILRDPSGGVTAYHRPCGPLDVYASDAALLAAAAGDPLEPDLEYLRQWLTFPFLRGCRTGVRGVHELLPGTFWRAQSTRALPAPVWTPRDHTDRRRTITDPGTAAAVLREEILGAVPRLASVASDPVLQLSGGLDSSIVAAALAETGVPFRAVTFATRAPDGDERSYARTVARHCGVELIELVEEAAAPDFEAVPDLSPRPAPSALLRPIQRALSNHLALTGAGAMLDGAGGDNVFCYLNSASPALDAFRRGGPRRGLVALQDVAQVHGTTVWAAARAAWRRSRRPRDPWQPDQSFLTPGTAALKSPDHPWLEQARTADRGTFEHIQLIVGIHHFLADPAPGGAAVLHPLLAQPIVEACLRIPSWLWVRGGRDRAMARAAFGGLLPDAILARRSKGQLGSLFMTGYMGARQQLERLLLEGRLAAEGLLDRGAIRDYLRRTGQPGDPGYLRLIELSAAEAWLRSFER
jgi:asparagine synthase (glutamine-hydrolysing)